MGIFIASYYHQIGSKILSELVVIYIVSPYMCHFDPIDGILPKGAYPPWLRMVDRALLAGYPRDEFRWALHLTMGYPAMR